MSTLHARFLAILPKIRTHGQICFRGLKCRDKRMDALSEMVALCWKWFARLVEKGKDPAEFPSALATYAVRAVLSGRRLTGVEGVNDVMSYQAQQRYGFHVESLPSSTAKSYEEIYGSVHGQQKLDAFAERLRDNTKTPVDEQAAFRIDFPAWRRTRCERDRRLLDDMMLGERTKDLADKHGLTPGRVSQLRREFQQDWQRYQGDDQTGQLCMSVA